MKEFELKYGCNPNQKPSKIYMHDGSELPIEILCGRAKFIHTYNDDGNPLPTFEGEPKTLELPAMDIDGLTHLIWTNLNEDNKVSLFVRYIDLATGEAETRIVNKNV